MESDNSTAQLDNGIAPVAGDVNAGLVNEPVAAPAPSFTPEPKVEAPKTFSWKSSLRTDLKDSPLSQKFEDTPDGLNKALESYSNLEKLLGHEKVPIPKGPEDMEGWSRYRKAFGIPEKPEGYKLEDIKLPESMKDMVIDKTKFAEVAHSLDLTPAQAAKQWKIYNDINAQTYEKFVQGHKTRITQAINTLKQEWGDTYQVNVELGQTVINKFSDDQDTHDYLTAKLSDDPRGIKFLSKVGNQFAENKVGEFQMKRFAMSPEEARVEIETMTRDLDGAYMNIKGKFSESEHLAAIARRDTLQAVINRAKG